MFSGWWAIVLIVLVFAGALYQSAAMGRRRRERLRVLADQLNLSFDPAGGGVLEREFARFHLFQQGRSRRAHNLLYGGAAEREVLIFDYEYLVGGGKSQHTYRQSVIALPLGRATLPDFEVRPENIFDKIGAAFGYQDIDFPERPGFSSRYLVRGKDEEAVRTLFDGRRIEAFESVRGVSVEGGGAWIVVYHAGKRKSSLELSALLEEARAIRDAFARR